MATNNTTTTTTPTTPKSPTRPDKKSMADYTVPGAPPPRRNVLIVPAHHIFAAILTKRLLNFGGVPPFQCYRFGPIAPPDMAGGVYVRGSTIEAATIDKVLKQANIHIVVRLLLRNSSDLDSQVSKESDIYNENIRDTNALLQALTRHSNVGAKNAHGSNRPNRPTIKIKTILVSGMRSSIIGDVLGNTILAAEALWLGRAIRQNWDSMVVRSAVSESPWDCSTFIEFCYGIWDSGLHPHDLSEALALMIDRMTDEEETFPTVFRSTVWELKNKNQGLQNGPTNEELTTMKKYGLVLNDTYEDDEEGGGEEEDGDWGKVEQEGKGGKEGSDGKDGKEGKEGKEGGGENAAFIAATQRMLGDWQPQYRKRQVLEDLSRFGFKGPPRPAWLVKLRNNTFSNNDGIEAVHYGNTD